ncbi:tetratricopeptide (TPR) repeat protein [Crossiella equi]|uniref:Tetratricopeptide (TPR) repeat protein n=1 Tax=Crossiella equi TaxID=130796 RepID=A0ABS5A8X5_9PSEU|nr:hypothetical protein [Crossiella equi]MBP2473033.1 tetratricopeptide (TPR) repeat protein [Crossiella equi]
MTQPIEVTADYNGDGGQDTATWAPETGRWEISLPTGPVTVQHGVKGDLPVPGDYRGAGRAQVAVVRASDRVLAVKDSGTEDWATARYRPKAGHVPGIVALAQSAAKVAHRLHVQGRFAEAAELSRLERDLYRKLAETPGYERFLPDWGSAALRLGGNLGLARQTAEGVLACYEGLDVLRRVGDELLVAGAYEAVANAFHSGGRFSEAVPPCVRRVEITRALGKRAEQVRALISLSGNLALSARVEDAIAQATEAVRVAEELGEVLPRATAHDQLATLYGGYTANLDAAQRHGLLAVRLYEQLPLAEYRNPFGHVLGRYSGTQSRRGVHADAVAYAQRSIEVWAPLANRDLDANGNSHLALVLEAAGRLPEAVRPSRTATDLYRQLLRDTAAEVYRPLLAGSVFRLARALAAAGDRDGARTAVDEAIEQYDRLGATAEARRAREFRATL